jgi:hypothetical protein
MFIAISEKVTKPLRWRVHCGYNGVTFERAALWGRTNGNHAPPLNGRVRALQRGGGCADRFDWKTALRRRTPRGSESPGGSTNAAARLIVQRGSAAGAVRIVRGGPGRTRCRGGAGCAWQRGLVSVRRGPGRTLGGPKRRRQCRVRIQRRLRWRRMRLRMRLLLGRHGSHAGSHAEPHRLARKAVSLLQSGWIREQEDSSWTNRSKRGPRVRNTVAPV